MTSRHAYVIVTSGPDLVRQVVAGRHRVGAPGTIPRYPVARRRSVLHRARHRRVQRPSAFAARYTSVLILLGTLTISGWFALAGATAFAQMIQP